MPLEGAVLVDADDDVVGLCSADALGTRAIAEESFSSVTVLSPGGEINRELTRRSRTSGKCRGRRAEGSRDVVRVREVSGVRADRPPAMARAVFDSGAEQAIWILPLDAVVERCVEHRRLRRRVSGDRQPSCRRWWC